jgi:hypothetical protein
MKTTITQYAKITIAFALLFSFKAEAQTVQYTTLMFSQTSMSVQTNQVISVVGFDWVDYANLVYLDQIYGVLGAQTPSGLTIDITPVGRFIQPNTDTTASFYSQIPQIITGVTNINLNWNDGNFWATLKIETPTASFVASNYIPADAVVIPASATGNVQIILESSPDLINWTAANPGIYGSSSATNRFFRVRAVVQ